MVQGTAVVLAATSDLGSWSMSTYRMSMHTSATSRVDRLNTEGSRDSASRLMCGNPICRPFSNMPQVTTMQDKPGCVQTLPTISKSSYLGRTNSSIVLSHLIRVPHGFLVSVPGGNDLLGYLHTLL